MNKIKRHTLEWFENRIGKFIYRKKLKCQCKECQDTKVKIHDRQHAHYIHLCQDELGIEYFDKEATNE